ncbi:TPA: DUF4405 domain-containing protein [Candidatus Woesearchaeota archaeon]|nr:DUF4405 domain-containing protein [Candidatus Woesearchaeota archaeon]
MKNQSFSGRQKFLAKLLSVNKNHIKYAIDIGLLVTFILSGITGILKFPGLTQYFRGVYRAIPAYTISQVHDWSGLIMVLLVLAHLVFNWNWIVCMTKNIIRGKKKCD